MVLKQLSVFNLSAKRKKNMISYKIQLEYPNREFSDSLLHNSSVFVTLFADRTPILICVIVQYSISCILFTESSVSSGSRSTHVNKREMEMGCSGKHDVTPIAFCSLTV